MKKIVLSIIYILSSIICVHSQFLGFNNCSVGLLSNGCVSTNPSRSIHVIGTDDFIEKDLVYDAERGIKVTDFSDDNFGSGYGIFKAESGFSKIKDAPKVLVFKKENLSLNTYYKISFYYSNGTFLTSSNQSQRGLWSVKLGNTYKTSAISQIRKHTLWEKANLIIKYEGGPKEIVFTPIGFGSQLTDQFLLIDDIRIVRTSSNPIPSEEVDRDCESFGSFNPILGKKYVLSGWVKKETTEQVKTYNNVQIRLNFGGSTSTSIIGEPSGVIIEGWQQIQQEFTIPSGATSISVLLQNLDTSQKAYFDDIRIHPFDGNMKSFVYDPITQRLVAELDENNYATFYEYDKEGGLVRVKKETERGVKTIQETRSSTHKQY